MLNFLPTLLNISILKPPLEIVRDCWRNSIGTKSDQSPIYLNRYIRYCPPRDLPSGGNIFLSPTVFSTSFSSCLIVLKISTVTDLEIF